MFPRLAPGGRKVWGNNLNAVPWQRNYFRMASSVETLPVLSYLIIHFAVVEHRESWTS